MRKHYIFVLLVAAMLLPWARAAAQDELLVAEQTGGDSSYYVPICGSYTDNGFWSEFIYPEDMISDMAGGTINTLTFQSIHTPSGNNYFDNDSWSGSTFNVYMSVVENDTYPSSSSGSWQGGNDMTLVFTGNLTLVNHFMTVELEEPFLYEGGNLCIRITNGGGATFHMAYWRCANVGHLASAYKTNTYSYPQTTYTTATNLLPECTFGYTAGGGSICRKPAGLAISGVGPYGATLTFTGRDEHEGWLMRYADHQFDPTDDEADFEEEELSDPEFEFSSLTSSTTYYVYVRGNCEGEGTSGWASTSFTTDILCYPVVDLAAQTTYTTAAITWAYQEGRGLAHDEVTVTLTDPSDPDFSETVTTSGTYAFFSGLQMSHAYLATVQNSCEGEPSSNATLQIATSGATMGSHPGNEASSFAPFYSTGEYSYSQTLYLASEVGGAATITGIEYNTTSSSGNGTYTLDVYAANTSQTTLGTNGISFANFTQVASGVSVSWVASGWISVPFTTPFAHDGTNLAIIVVAHRTGTSSGGTWNGISLSNSSRVLYKYGSSAIDPANVISPSTTNYMAGFRFLTTVDLTGCLAPNLLLTEVDSNNIHAVWVPGNSETSFRVEYKAENATEWTEAEASTTETVADLTGLNANTTYSVRVTPLCDDEDAPAAVKTVRTACGSISLPYTEGFEGYANYEQPSCWYFPQVYSSNYPSAYTGSYAYAGNGYLYTYGSSTSPNLVASPVVPTDADNIYCSFWARGVLPGSNMEVGIMTDPNSPSTFMAITPQATGQSANNYTEYEFVTTGLNISGQVHVAFRWTSGYGYLDNVFISEVPECMRPSSVTLSGITDASATVNIGAGNGATAYSIHISGGSLGTTVTLDEGETSYTFTDLTPATTYTVQVASVCSDGSTTAMTTDATFTTACGIIDQFPYLSQFDGSGALDCWTILSPLGHTGTRIWHQYTGSASSHEYVSYPSGAGIYNSSPSDDWLISPGFLLPENADNYVVQWYHFGEGTGSGTYNYQVLISTHGTAIADFDTVFTELHGGQVFELRTLSLADYAGDTVWIAFRNIANGGTGMIIDDFTVRDAGAPTLSLEAPSVVDANTAVTLTAHLMTGDPQGLTFTWTSAMQAVGQATLTSTDSIATITYTTDGLDTLKVVATNIYGSDSATVVIRVRDCQIITHASLPYQENFDSYTSGSTGELDPCWTRISLYSSYPNNPYPYSYTHHGASGNSIYFYPGNSSQPQLAVLPQFDDLSDLYVHLWGYRTSANVRMEVGVMTDPSDASTFEMVDFCAPTTTSTWEEFYVSLASYTGEGRYIALRGICTSSSGYTFYVDDLEVNVLGACVSEVRNLRASDATGDGFTVSWTPGFGLYDNATLTLLDSEGTTLQTIADAESPYTFTGLNAESSFQVRVDLNCNDAVAATATCSAMTLCADGFNVEVSATTTGRSSTTTHYVPIQTYYNYAQSQSVYTAHELGNAPMNIVSIAYNYTFATAMSGYSGSIYLRHQADSTISTMNVPGTNDQLVYTGDFNFENGWYTINFDTPFAYDGTSNIVLTVVAHGSYLSSDDRFAAHYAWNNSVRYYYSDNGAYSGSGDYSTSTRADVRFGTCGGEAPQPVGIDNATLANVRLYPNPAIGSVSVEFEGQATVSVIDLNGRQVLGTEADSRATFDVSRLAKGAYFVRVTSAAGTAVSKLVVK